jgi:hypothetical protein
MAKLDMVKDRFSKLCKSYIEKCIINDNPVFLDSFKEYLRYANGRILKHETIHRGTNKFEESRKY